MRPLNKQTQKRCDQLAELGLKFNGQEYRMNDINVHWTEIICDSDEEFEKKLSLIKKEIKKRAAKKKHVLLRCKKRFWMKEGAKHKEVAFSKDKVYEAVFEDLQGLKLWDFTANDQGEKHTLEESDILKHFDSIPDEQEHNLRLNKLDFLSNLYFKVMDSSGNETGLLPLNAGSITALEIFLKRYRRFVEEYCGGTYEDGTYL